MIHSPSDAAGAIASLSAQQIQALGQARLRSRKISRAATTAAVSGWTTAVFAVLTVLFGIFSLPALLLGAGLVAVAYIEIRGSQALRRFDLSAPKRLALNQVALFFMLALYCGWALYSVLTTPSPYAQYIAAGDELSKMVKPIAQLNTLVSIVLYSGVLLGSLVAQGLAAIYYYTRRRHITGYLQATPTWVVEALRAAA